MKVAITGATGFIGRHVIASLLAQNVEVVATARMEPKASTSGDSLTFVKFDISDPAGAFESLGEPDVLLHLAWGGLPNYRSDTHLLVELPRQIEFLSACSRSGLRRLIVAGTCLEYGMQSGQLHEDLPVEPTTAYGQSKVQLHQYLRKLEDSGGPSLTWLRLFYLYGPGQAPTSLYSQLQSAVASGASEFPMSPGDQRRDFIAIDAAVEHICTLALMDFASGTVNVCSGVPIDVATHARNLLQSWGSKLPLALGRYPYPDYEPHDFWGDARKLDSMVGKR